MGDGKKKTYQLISEIDQLQETSDDFQSQITPQEQLFDSKQVVETLRQYEHIVSSSTDMQAMLDTDFVYLAANPAYLKAFGKTEGEIVDHSVSEIFGEEFFDTVIRPHAEQCLAGNEIRYQDWFEFPASGQKYMDIVYSPYLGHDNVVQGFAVTGRDITEFKQAENELKQSKVFIDNAINAQVDTFFVFDPKTGKAIRWNENFSRVSG